MPPAPRPPAPSLPEHARAAQGRPGDTLIPPARVAGFAASIREDLLFDAADALRSIRGPADSPDGSPGISLSDLVDTVELQASTQKILLSPPPGTGEEDTEDDLATTLEADECPTDEISESMARLRREYARPAPERWTTDDLTPGGDGG